MSILVGYGQNINHINTKPDIKTEIYDLSTMSTSWYYPEAPKTNDLRVVLARKPRYCFNVSAKSKKESTAYRHSYYFDNKEEATEEHRKLKVRLYDQLTTPILKKLKHSSQLSIHDQTNLYEIMRRIENLR